LKKAALGLLLLLLICGLLVSLRSAVYAEVKTWIVDLNGSGDFTNIQDGINAANSGDTVFVKAATYQENILLNTSISLIGEARETTIIDVRGIGNPLEITANGTIVSGFTFSYGDAGIVMTNSHNNLIIDNVLRKNSRGIGGSLYTNTTIENNTVTENDYGIDFGHLGGPSSKNNTAKNNEIYNNTEAGIYVSASEGNNSIVDNYFHDNGYAIVLDHTQHNVVFGNNITDNTCGFYLRNAIQNRIVGNHLEDNLIGIYFESSNGNYIFHNDFSDNIVQVGGSSYNTWDDGYPSGGNYWSDYKGTDSDEDGIGDTPYVIDEDNTDHYPLMVEQIIPDFAGWLFLPFLLLATMSALILKKKLRK
jgi:parallel beta-helix repeat protein